MTNKLSLDKFDKEVQQIDHTSCSVCGNFKSPLQYYCAECEKYKKHADDLRKSRARQKAFGDIL